MNSKFEKIIYLLIVFSVLVSKIVIFKDFFKVYESGFFSPINKGIDFALFAYVLFFFLRDKSLAIYYSLKNVKLYILVGCIFWLIAFCIVLFRGSTFHELASDESSIKIARAMPVLSYSMWLWALLIYFEGVFNRFILWLQKRNLEG